MRTGWGSAATSLLAGCVRLVADGAPGIWKAVRELWRAAERQRCTVHALRNLTSKLPERHHNEVKARYWQILDDAASVGEAKTGLLALAATTSAPTRRPLG